MKTSFMKDSLPLKNNLYLMKNLFKTVLFAAIGAVTFVSCNSKDDFDYEGERQRVLEQEKLIDAQLSKESIEIEDYVTANFGSGAQADSLLIPFQVLEKKVKRGFWYDVVTTPTEEDDKAYTWELTTSGYSYIAKPAKVKLKYTAKLLDGTIVESDLEGSNYDITPFKTDSKVFTSTWYYTFIPYSIKNNSNNTVIGGFTKNGLKKGSKIRVVTPSIYAYGSVAKEADGTNTLVKIPANSPLVYEFEVLSIQ